MLSGVLWVAASLIAVVFFGSLGFLIADNLAAGIAELRRCETARRDFNRGLG